jgi:hypothetical protein
MDIRILKRLRGEADKYYHMRLETNGEYGIFFHNYKVVKMDSTKNRSDGFKLLNHYKREHILNRLKQYRNK